MGEYVDQLRSTLMPAGTLALRIYWDIYGPLAPHPHPDGRMAQMQDVPLGFAGCGGLYLASLPGGAFWEVILRDLQPVNGIITLPPGRLDGRSLIMLRSTQPLVMLDLTLPERRNLFAGRDAAGLADAETLWRLILESPDHTQSHYAAAEIANLARRTGVKLAGVTWLSAQHQASRVHLLNDPPYTTDQWERAGDPIALTSPGGLRALRQALTDVNMELADPGTPFPCEDDDL